MARQKNAPENAPLSTYDYDGLFLPHEVRTWDYGRKNAVPVWAEFVFRGECDQNWSYSHHRPALNAIEIVIAGDMSVTLNDRTFSVRAGEAAILPAGTDNRLRTGASGFCRKVSIGIGGTLASPLLSALKLDTVGVAVPLRRSEQLHRLLRELADLLANRREEDAPHNSALCVELLTELGLSVKKAPPPQLGDAIRVLEYHLAVPVKIREIAEILGMTENRLTRLFRAELGTTPKQYLIDRRMEKAELLLRNAALNITDISQMTGYGSPLRFSREFRKKFGVSPMHYRKKPPKTTE